MYVFPTLTTLLFTFAFFSYLHVYYKHYVYKTSWDWQEDQTLLGHTLTKDFSNANRILIESQPQNIIYIKFFNATQNKQTNAEKYAFFSDLSFVSPQEGDIVAISGWKGTPEQFTKVKELKMLNNSTGYKVGEWKNNE